MHGSNFTYVYDYMDKLVGLVLGLGLVVRFRVRVEKLKKYV